MTLTNDYLIMLTQRRPISILCHSKCFSPAIYLFKSSLSGAQLIRLHLPKLKILFIVYICPAEVKHKFPSTQDDLIRIWIGDKISNHAKTATKRALRQQVD